MKLCIYSTIPWPIFVPKAVVLITWIPGGFAPCLVSGCTGGVWETPTVGDFRRAGKQAEKLVMKTHLKLLIFFHLLLRLVKDVFLGGLEER